MGDAARGVVRQLDVDHHDESVLTALRCYLMQRYVLWFGDACHMTEVGYTYVLIKWLRRPNIYVVDGHQRALVGCGPAIVAGVMRPMWCVVMLIGAGLSAEFPSHGMGVAFSIFDLSGVSTARVDVVPSLTTLRRLFQIDNFCLGHHGSAVLSNPKSYHDAHQGVRMFEA